jgi:hypothetical protein
LGIDPALTAGVSVSDLLSVAVITVVVAVLMAGMTFDEVRRRRRGR